MKIKIVSWLLVFAGTQMLLSGVIFGSSLVKKITDMNGLNGLNKITVNIKNTVSKEAAGSLTQKDIEQLTRILDNGQITYSAEKKTQVEGGNGKSDAIIIGTNSLYDEFNNLGIKAGSYFTEKSERESDRVAVIQDSLARELFNTDNVVGLSIEMFGQSFRITGVASESGSIIQAMSESGIYPVYIPASTLLELEEEERITSFQLKTKDSSTLGINRNEIITALSAIGKSPFYYKIIDYNIEKALITQKPLFLVFLMGFAGIVVLLTYVKNKTLNVYRNISCGLEAGYLTGRLNRNRFDLALKLAGILSAVIAVMIIWNTVSFKLYIPANYIPDKLTELSYYTDLLKSSWQEMNLNAGYIAPLYERAYSSAVVLLDVLLCIALLGGFGLFYIGFYQLRLQNTDIEEAITFGSIAFLSGMAILVVVSCMTAIPLVIELKNLFTVYGFLVLNIIYFLKNDRRKAAIEKTIQTFL